MDYPACAAEFVDSRRDQATFVTMEIQPTADQEGFIREAVEAGRIARPQDAIVQALALWEERERRRAELLADLDEAEQSILHDRGVAITPDTMRDLAAQVKRRGRLRLKASSPAS